MSYNVSYVTLSDKLNHKYIAKARLSARARIFDYSPTTMKTFKLFLVSHMHK